MILDPGCRVDCQGRKKILDEKHLCLQNIPSAQEMIRLIVAAFCSPRHQLSMCLSVVLSFQCLITDDIPNTVSVYAHESSADMIIHILIIKPEQTDYLKLLHVVSCIFSPFII